MSTPNSKKRVAGTFWDIPTGSSIPAFSWLAFCSFRQRLILRARAMPSDKPRIHLIQNMDNQPKYLAQHENLLFNDGRAMRPRVPGTVAQGDMVGDTHFSLGLVNGAYATVFPPQVHLNDALLDRGRDRFNIYCLPCHGVTGEGNGRIHNRAMVLLNNGTNGTVWVQPRNLHQADMQTLPQAASSTPSVMGSKQWPATLRRSHQPIAGRSRRGSMPCKLAAMHLQMPCLSPTRFRFEYEISTGVARDDTETFGGRSSPRQTRNLGHDARRSRGLWRVGCNAWHRWPWRIRLVLEVVLVWIHGGGGHLSGRTVLCALAAHHQGGLVRDRAATCRGHCRQPPMVVDLVHSILVLVWTGKGAVLFEWCNVEYMQSDHVLAGKMGYLNATFWSIRAVVYLGVWALLARFYRTQSVAQDSDGDVRRTMRMQWWAPIGIILYAFTQTFAAVDWIMAIQPKWFSTMFGVYWFAVSCTGFFASIIILITVLRGAGYGKAAFTREHFQDLGKLLFAFGVVFWAYIGYSQYMLIWYANIPIETEWFVPRQLGGWFFVSWLLIIGHFALPICAADHSLDEAVPQYSGAHCYLDVGNVHHRCLLAIDANGARSGVGRGDELGSITDRS